jgi:Protein of unknown function (DUF3579)
MDTVLDPVSSAVVAAGEHPPEALPCPRSEPTQSAAAAVQPGNAPIAQPVGTNNVSTTHPAGSVAALSQIVASKPREVFIQGLTSNGKPFRPSDWAERLAGAMSCFRPGGAKGGIGAHIGYSPYCVPTSIGNVKCVVVNEALKGIEPMAWDFVMSFAKDNDLQVVEACLLPDPPR